MSAAQDLIDEAKRIRQRLRDPPNAVHDPGIDLTRKSTAHKGHEPIPDPPIKKVLELPESREPTFPPMEIRFPITFDNILEAVSTHYGVSTASLRGSDRHMHTCLARFVVVYLSLKLLAKRSLSSIARDLDKDHTSILHARNRINAIILDRPEVAAEVLMLERHIETLHSLRPAVPTFCERGVAIQPWPSPPGPEVSILGG